MMDSRMATARTRKRASSGPERLINRELSFLDYDARVLALASDPDLPLLERVKFCSIVSTMLDEFFMVRVAGLTSASAAGVTVRSPDGRTPQQALTEARERVLELDVEQARIWADELCPALAAEGIHITTVEALSPSEHAELVHRYETDIYPVLTPLAVGPGQPFPYISALSVSLAVFVRDPESGEERFARVKMPEGLPRFLSVGTKAGSCRSSGCSRTSCRRSSQGWRSSSGRCSASRATPTSRSRTRRTTCSRPSSSSCAGDASAR